jgi:arylsulfatase A-like enzyme
MDEDLTHVPLLVHLPGQAQGQVVAGLASGLDVVPTLLARVYQHPPALPGLALEAPIPADRIVASWGLYRRFLERPDRHAVAAYQGDYKYMRFYPGGTEALYDLSHGLQDVTAAHPERLAALRAYVEGHFRLPAP